MKRQKARWLYKWKLRYPGYYRKILSKRRWLGMANKIFNEAIEKGDINKVIFEEHWKHFYPSSNYMKPDFPYYVRLYCLSLAAEKWLNFDRGLYFEKIIYKIKDLEKEIIHLKNQMFHIHQELDSLNKNYETKLEEEMYSETHSDSNYESLIKNMDEGFEMEKLEFERNHEALKEKISNIEKKIREELKQFGKDFRIIYVFYYELEKFQKQYKMMMRIRDLFSFYVAHKEKGNFVDQKSFSF